MHAGPFTSVSEIAARCSYRREHAPRRMMGPNNLGAKANRVMFVRIGCKMLYMQRSTFGHGQFPTASRPYLRKASSSRCFPAPVINHESSFSSAFSINNSRIVLSDCHWQSMMCKFSAFIFAPFSGPSDPANWKYRKASRIGSSAK